MMTKYGVEEKEIDLTKTIILGKEEADKLRKAAEELKKKETK